MLRIAICDDESDILIYITSVLNKAFGDYTKDFKIYKFNSGKILLNEHRKEKFDIIFLDIDMPELTGFDIAKELRNEYSSCNIVFVTSHSELVYDSFDFQPFGFVRKNHSIPIDESLYKVVKKLMSNIKQNESVMLEDDLSGRRLVKLRDIMYIESDRHYVFFHTYGSDRPVKIRSTIKECEDKFIPYDFVRIHRQIIVNLYNLEVINNNDEVVIKKTGLKLPISRNYKKSVDEKYTLFLRSRI